MQSRFLGELMKGKETLTAQHAPLNSVFIWQINQMNML